MAAQPKFLFDTDFAPAAEKRPAMTLSEHEARCAERESAAYQRGVAAAEARIEAHAQQMIAAALGTIGAGIEQLTRNLQALETRLENEAIEVAVAVGGKLAPELIAREPPPLFVASTDVGVARDAARRSREAKARDP